MSAGDQKIIQKETNQKLSKQQVGSKAYVLFFFPLWLEMNQHLFSFGQVR